MRPLELPQHASPEQIKNGIGGLFRSDYHQIRRFGWRLLEVERHGSQSVTMLRPLLDGEHDKIDWNTFEKSVLADLHL